MIDLQRHKPLSALTEWEDNYNRGDVALIARSIRRFGFNGSLRVWGSGIVLAGNHTLKALRLIQSQGADPALDHQFPPTNVIVDGDEWYVSFIDVSHLDPLEAKGFAIADNTSARKAVVDEVRLADFLKEIRDHDQTMLLSTGHTVEQVNELVSRMSTTFSPLPMEGQGRLDKVGTYCDVCGKRLHDGG